MTDAHEFDELEDDLVEHPLPNVEKVISGLQSENYPEALHSLTGLSVEDTAKVKPVWEDLALNIRQSLLETAVEMSEADNVLNYRNFGLMARNDSDPTIRAFAIQLFYKDEDLEILEILHEIAKVDKDVDVRATAVKGLGMFVLLGEYDKIPEGEILPVQETLAELWGNSHEAFEIRRSALESLANSQHAIVPNAIQIAYDSDDKLLNLSAIIAMGRTYDKQWRDIVLDELDNDDPEIRFEAVRASGELTLSDEDAVMKLAQIIQEDDRAAKLMAIWALGEIGSQQAINVLDDLGHDSSDSDDEELISAIEEAYSNASFMGEFSDIEF